MKVLDLKNPFGAPIYHEEVLSSTFDAARLLAAGNEPHGTVIAADFQEAGRGRQNRSWKTEKGTSLLFTILLRYRDFSSIPKVLTLRTGLAVSLALEDLVPALAASIRIKWPNDIMICSRKAQAAFKAAGILAETDGSTVYIGIGVNVAQKKFPDEYHGKAGSIIQAYPELTAHIEDIRFPLLEKILLRLHDEIEKPQGDFQSSDWRERLHRRLYKIGGMVTFAEGAAEYDQAEYNHAGSGHIGSSRIIEGTLSGIGPGGELLIIPRGEEKERAFITGELRVY